MSSYEEMNYKELSESAKNLGADIINLTRQKEDLAKSIASEQANLSSLEEQKNKTIESNKKEALDKIIEEKTKSFNDELNELNQKRYRADENYLNHIKKITRDRFTNDELEEKISNSADILDVIEECKEIVKEHLGEPFYNSLMDRFSESVTDIEIHDATSLLDVFSKSKTDLRRIQKLNKFQFVSKLTSLVNKLSEKINLNEKEIDNESLKRRLLISLVIGIVISALIIWKGLAVLLVFLALMAVINTFTSYRVYKLAYHIKSVEDSISNLHDLYEGEITSAMDEAKEKAKEKYNTYVSKLESAISEVNCNMTSTIDNIKSSFEFNSADIEVDFQKRNQDKLKAIQEINSHLIDIDSKIELIKKDITLIENIKKEKVEEYVDSRINTLEPGTDVVFDGEFVVDIDKLKREPIIWYHPKDTAVYLYNKEEEANDFILGIVNQLFTKLFFRELQIDYVDHFTLGAPLVEFKKSVLHSGDFFAMYFQTEPEEFDNYITRVKEHVASFISKSGGTSTFEEYNEMMRERDSTTIPYRFIFIKDVPAQLLADKNLTKSFDSWTNAGVYVHLLFNKENFDELSDTSIKSLNRYKFYYELHNGLINKIPLSKVLKQANLDED